MRLRLLLQVWVSFGLLLTYSPPTQAQQPAPFQWATAGGGPAFDTGDRVKADRMGNVYMAGTFTGTAYFGTTKLSSVGGFDIYLAKYDVQGQLLWVRQAGGPDQDKVGQMTVDATGNVVLSGSFDGFFTSASGPLVTMTFGSLTLTGGSRQSELYVAKYDAQGNVLWAQQTVGQNGSYGGDLALDGDGNSYVVGTYNGAVRFPQLAIAGAGYGQHFLAKYDRLGQLVWVKTGLGDYTLNLNIYSNTFLVAVDSNNDVYLTGQFNQAIRLGNITLTSPTAVGGHYLAKLDAQGTFLWARQDVLTGQENCTAFAVSPTGSLLFTCEFSGTSVHPTRAFTSRGGPDLLTLSFSAAGEFMWGAQEGSGDPGQGTDQIGQLAFDGQGNSYTTLFSNAQFWVVSYSPTASLRAKYTVPLYVGDIAFVAPDALAVTGVLTSPTTFGVTRLPSAGSADAYLAKLLLPALSSPPVVSVPAFIPNVITPNGDGQNDKFQLRGLPAGAWQLSVYSRWGARVYQAADYHQDWEAAGLANGTYYYCLQSTGQPLVRGWVEVIR